MNNKLKKLIVPLLFLLLSNIYGQDMTMLLLPKEGAEESRMLYLSRGLNDIFLTDLVPECQKYFPCIGITDPKSTELCIGELKLQGTAAFGSRDVNPIIQKITNSVLNCDYAVKYCMYIVSEQTVRASVTCANSEGEIIADFTMTSDMNSFATAETIPPVKKLIEELKKHEICPFCGPVTIEVKTELDDSSTDYLNAPCGGGQVTINTTSKMNSTTKWKLNKDDFRNALGTVNYDINENINIESDYSCMKCENGNQGAAKITETIEKEAKVEGLSNESVKDGTKTDDARIKLVFFENGTYTVLVKATSEKGMMKETTEKKVEGICQDENEPKDTENKQIDVPIVVVLGPYPGTPTDKVLQQNETKDLSQGKEKTTMTIDFTLTQKN